MPHLRIVPDDLWAKVKARQARLDERLKRQKEAAGGRSARAGIGATRRNLNLLTEILRCGVCGSKMTASGKGYVKCTLADRTGGSACTNNRNYRRDRIEARVLEALKQELMRPEALTAFIKAFNAEIANLNAERARARQRP